MKTKKAAVIYAIGVMFAIVLGLVPAATLWANAEGTASPSPSIATVQATYGKLPLSFEANQGQTDAQVQFLTRGRGHQLYLTPSEAVLTLRTDGAKTDGRADHAAQHKPLSSPPSSSHSAVRMKFEGADPQAEVIGLDPLPGIVNYFIGDDPSKWRTNIPTYQKVEYKNVYPGIDLVYYGNQGQLEYDLVVAPGADPTQIMLAFDGAQQIAVDAQGDLVLTLTQSSTETAEGAASTLRLHKPVVYQRDEQGKKHLLAGTYMLRAAETAAAHPTVALHPWETQHVVFQIASYDASKPLIIDPVLSWATYLGGSGQDVGNGIAIDAVGNAYVTGSTDAPGSGFPGTAGSLIQRTNGGVRDAYVTKLNTTGSAILYSTYLGGSDFDRGFGIAVDAAGNAYVTGDTRSSNFPGSTGSSIQSTSGGAEDVFVTKLNATGTVLLYSTYLGGSGGEYGDGIAVDVAGQAYVTGNTASSDFPGTAGSLIQSTYGGGEFDAFVTKINATGTALVYSTYLGGSDFEEGREIAVNAAGDAYVTGGTQSSDFPGTTENLIQSTYGGVRDAYVAKLNAAGTALVYSTYLGGSDFEEGRGIAVDAAGNAYVTGGTRSSGFPGTAGSLLQRTNSGDSDAYVTKINAAGTAILYSTYLGGSLFEQGVGIAVDGAGNAYVTGETQTLGSGFPGTASSPIQSTHGGGLHDAFVAKLNAAGTAILYSTYLGGSGNDLGEGIALDAAGNAYMTGITDTPGSGFPGTAASPILSTYGGGVFDAFVAKISSSIPFAAFDARAKIDVDERRNLWWWILQSSAP